MAYSSDEDAAYRRGGRRREEEREPIVIRRRERERYEPRSERRVIREEVITRRPAERRARSASSGDEYTTKEIRPPPRRRYSTEEEIDIRESTGSTLGGGLVVDSTISRNETSGQGAKEQALLRSLLPTLEDPKRRNTERPRARSETPPRIYPAREAYRRRDHSYEDDYERDTRAPRERLVIEERRNDGRSADYYGREEDIRARTSRPFVTARNVPASRYASPSPSPPPFRLSFRATNRAREVPKDERTNIALLPENLELQDYRKPDDLSTPIGAKTTVRTRKGKLGSPPEASPTAHSQRNVDTDDQKSTKGTGRSGIRKGLIVPYDSTSESEDQEATARMTAIEDSVRDDQASRGKNDDLRRAHELIAIEEADLRHQRKVLQCEESSLAHPPIFTANTDGLSLPLILGPPEATTGTQNISSRNREAPPPRTPNGSDSIIAHRSGRRSPSALSDRVPGPADGTDRSSAAAEDALSPPPSLLSASRQTSSHGRGYSTARTTPVDESFPAKSTGAPERANLSTLGRREGALELSKSAGPVKCQGRSQILPYTLAANEKGAQRIGSADKPSRDCGKTSLVKELLVPCRDAPVGLQSDYQGENCGTCVSRDTSGRRIQHNSILAAQEKKLVVLSDTIQLRHSDRRAIDLQGKHSNSSQLPSSRGRSRVKGQEPKRHGHHGSEDSSEDELEVGTANVAKFMLHQGQVQDHSQDEMDHEMSTSGGYTYPPPGVPFAPLNESCLPNLNPFLTGDLRVLSAAIGDPSESDLRALLHDDSELCENNATTSPADPNDAGIESDAIEDGTNFTSKFRPPQGHALSASSKQFWSDKARSPSPFDVSDDESIKASNRPNRPNRPTLRGRHGPKDSRPTGRQRSQQTAKGRAQDELARLRRENAELKSELNGPTPAEGWPVLHRVICPDNTSTTYADLPMLVESGGQHIHFDGRRRIPNEEGWEASQEDVPFVVYLIYKCPSDSPERRTGRKGHAPSSSVSSNGPNGEEVRILSKSLQYSLDSLSSRSPGLRAYREDGVLRNEFLVAPYPFFFQFEDAFKDQLARLDFDDKDELELLMRYMRSYESRLSDAITKSFRAGYVTTDFMPYLFVPNELLMYQKAGTSAARVVRQSSVLRWASRQKKTTSETITEWQGSVDALFIRFDGKFWQDTTVLALGSLAQGTRMRITNLPVYPLKYATPEIRASMIERGRQLSLCQECRYVSSTSEENTTHSGGTAMRYMVDMQTYHLLHPNTSSQTDDIVPKNTYVNSAQEIEPSADDDDFLLQMPATIEAFHMDDKKWVKLQVGNISDIEWNREAFANLVIAPDTKELIEALVKNKLESDQSIDFVQGKGTGLIVLLHGGPGTGKTLTAESVAEIAGKPLYRVTCGDVGTDPVKVEKYLEGVFHLGRRWKCVVLLDEADVFLEQRTLANLDRNALVSVFLRTLEYYDGILILTSNRVGTFDEAFKSRIQLALHYPNLNIEQRTQIWANFIDRLAGLNEEVNIDEVRTNLAALAAYEMNGRQIRNSINTARQLARFKSVPMDTAHLKHVISVGQRFEKYLLDLNDGVGDDDFAHDGGIR